MDNILEVGVAISLKDRIGISVDYMRAVRDWLAKTERQAAPPSSRDGKVVRSQPTEPRTC